MNSVFLQTWPNPLVKTWLNPLVKGNTRSPSVNIQSTVLDAPARGGAAAKEQFPRYFPVESFLTFFEMLDQWMVRSMLVERLPPSNYSFPVGAVERCGGCVAPHCNRSRFSSRHHQLRDSTGRDLAPATSTENLPVVDDFFVFFFSSAMQSAVEMGDSAAAQSVEFRPQERPKLLPRFFGKERLSFAKSDNWRGRAAAGCLPLSLREEVHLHQPSSSAAATTGSALLGVNCKYLLIPLSFLHSLTCSLTLPVPTEETEKKAEASQHVKRK